MEQVGARKSWGSIFELLVYAAIMAGIFGTYFAYPQPQGFLLFHTLAESFAIFILSGMFIVSWNTRHYAKNTFFLVMGVSSFYIALIELLHTLAYKGMNVFIGYTPVTNLPTQLWIAGRYFQAISIFVALLAINKTINSRILIESCTIAFLALVILIFTGLFPVAHDGITLTPFKIASEYVVDFILGISAVLLIIHRTTFPRKVFILTLLFIIFLMISEIWFTLYVSVYDLTNLIGHLVMIVAYICAYKAIIQINLEDPIAAMFKKITESSRNLSDMNAKLHKEITERVRAENVLHQFLATTSHELRTPITVLEQSIQNLISFNDKLQEDQRDKLLSGISRNINLMAELVEDLLTLSRIDEGKILLEKKEMKFDDLITDVVNLMEPVLKEKGIEAIISGDNDVMYVGDRTIITKVIRIFIDNAIKYSHPDSQIQVHVAANYTGEYNASANPGLLIEFVDHGIGIDETFLPKLFQRFSRSEQVKNQPGTGLGLAIAKEMVALHGGSIHVSTEVGEGTTFSIFLPRQESL
ncbi:MAG TPA: MASE3 domain-containing protein [Candidatus Lokiarchaeia archaeon]|nr:MASE3 domain-containing protein [Candidatus Lokiarchaeia archaeon]